MSDISCAKSLLCPLNNDAIDELLAEPSFEEQQNESFLETSSNNMHVKINGKTDNAQSVPVTNTVDQLNAASPAHSTNLDVSARTVGKPDDIESTNEDHSDTDEDFDPDLFNLQSDTSSTSSESDNLVSSEDDSDASDEIQPNAIPSEENANGENEWQDIDDSIPSFEEFTENCKINITDDTVNPENYYNLFVTDDVISKMVVETNNYAQKFLAGNQLKPKSRVRAWIPTNPDEIKIWA